MGEVFAGRYELLDPLGAGGMGTVWRAHDRKLGRVVAVKVLRQADAASLMRFMREQALRIDHAHVLTPLGWAGEDDRVLFAMPVVPGGSVATLIGDYGALPPLYAAELLRQLLQALGAVHAQRVVHRDVKPANLLLEATGTARPHLLLSDFGIAVGQDEPRLTRPSLVVGTPGYLAPEQMWGADPDPRADLYAAGMVAVEMLTGRPPVVAQREAHAPLPDTVPEALRSLVEDLVQPEPSRRPASATAARARLDQPALSWPAGGQDEVEVFAHVGALEEVPGTGSVEVVRPGQEQHADGAVTGRLAPPPTRRLGVAAATVRLRATAAQSRLQGFSTTGRAVADDGVRRGAGGQGSERGASGAPGIPRAALAMFVLAGVVLLTTVLLVLRPWGGDKAGSEPMPGAPAAGDTCLFSDIGQVEVAADGTTVSCRTEDDGVHRWVP